MKTTQVTEFDYPVIVKSKNDGTFTIVYGLEKTECKTFNAAAAELGSCILHSMACAGKLEI